MDQLAGFRIVKGALDRAAQEALVAEVRAVVAAAPLFSPVTPGGRQMKVRMTSAGAFGWLSDARGYRYATAHPSGVPWPPIPPMVLDLWQTHAGTERAPESCLVNYYGEGVAMGLHQDSDERDMTQPVLSISLGDPARFRIGGLARRDPTRSMRVESGDVLVLGGAARRAYHGIDRVYFGQGTLLPAGGRINLTVRVVT